MHGRTHTSAPDPIDSQQPVRTDSAATLHKDRDEQHWVSSKSLVDGSNICSCYTGGAAHSHSDNNQPGSQPTALQNRTLHARPASPLSSSLFLSLYLSLIPHSASSFLHSFIHSSFNHPPLRPSICPSRPSPAPSCVDPFTFRFQQLTSLYCPRRIAHSFVPLHPSLTPAPPDSLSTALPRSLLLLSPLILSHLRSARPRRRCRRRFRSLSRCPLRPPDRRSTRLASGLQRHLRFSPLLRSRLSSSLFSTLLFSFFFPRSCLPLATVRISFQALSHLVCVVVR